MPDESIPIWAIIIIAFVACTVIIALFFHIKKRRNNRLSVYAQADEEIQEKRSISEESLQTLVTQKHKSSLSSQKQSVDLPAVPSPPLPALTRNLTKYNDSKRMSVLNDRQRPLPKTGLSQHDSSDKIEMDEAGSLEAKPLEEFVAIELNDPNESAKVRLSSESSEIQERHNALPMETNEKNIIHHPSASISRSISSKNYRLSAAADTSDEKRKVKHGTPRFHSVRGLKSNEHLTITSGSMRRFVRESILVDDEKELPLPSTAAIVSSSSASKKSTANTNLLDITGWWDPSKAYQNDEAIYTDDNPPLNSTKSGEDSISIAQSPPQYRASLSNSVFNGTLSRSSAPDTLNALSRHGSNKKSGASGTLGKSTLKSITASTAQGVNRSVKSLFESSSKPLVDDSQKMEIDNTPVKEESSKIIQTSDADRIIDNASNYVDHHLLNEIPESSAKYAIPDEDSKKVTHMPEDDSFVNNNSIQVNEIRNMLHNTWDSKSMHNKVPEIDNPDSPQQSDSNLKITSSKSDQHSDSKAKIGTYDSEKQEAKSSVSHASTDFYKNPIPTHQLQQTLSNSERRRSQKTYESFRFSSTSSAILHDSNGYFPSPHQSSFDSVRYQSGNSSSNTSTATAVRLSCSMSNQTWNGRTNKSTPRPSVMQIEQQFKGEQRSERAYYSTMQKGRKVRGSIPWSTVRQEKTPAQIERDNYLEGKYSEV
ncbi:hypothetical protein BD560DRAFT_444613 [Blakeslea trispora]|nr:hypothetical protein BD560DRAFT_444613 [Blakeslea trispora]